MFEDDEIGADVAIDDAVVDQGSDELTSETTDSVQSDLDILSDDSVEDSPVADEKVEDGDKRVADEAKDDQQVEDESKPQDEKKAEAKPKADAKTAEDDKNTPATIKALRDRIEKNPTLKAELSKPENFDLRNMLFANARRSQELTDYKTMFPTPELAKAARESAQELTQIETALESKSPEGFDSVLKRMSESGSLQGFLQHQRVAHFWPVLDEMATNLVNSAKSEEEKNYALDVQDAIQIVRHYLGEGGKPLAAHQAVQPKAPAKPQYSPEDARKLAEYDSLKRQQDQATVEAQRQYEQSVVAAVKDDVKSALSERVKRLAPALSDPIRRRIVDDAYSEIATAAKSDPIYGRTWSQQFRDAKGTAEGKAALVKMASDYARGVAGPIIQKLVREFGSEAIKANTELHTKLKEQVKKAEVKTTGGTAPLRQGDVASMIREADKLSRSVNKRGLTDDEIMDVEEVLPRLQRLSKAR